MNNFSYHIKGEHFQRYVIYIRKIVCTLISASSNAYVDHYKFEGNHWTHIPCIEVLSPSDMETNLASNQSCDLVQLLRLIE